MALLVGWLAAAPLANGGAQERGDRNEDASEARERDAQIRSRQRLVALQKRVDLVADRLVRALTPTRRDSLPYLGLRVADHRAKDNALLAEALGLRDPEHPFVFSVDPTAPAGDADLQPGDQLLELAGKRLESSRSFYKATSKSNLSFPLRIVALREGREVPVELAAAHRPRGLEILVVGDWRNVYAYATGREIVLSTGMVSFAESDSELAAILGHEIAHVTRGHFSSSYLEAGGQPYFSQGLENEADARGLELSHRAGYDPAAAAALWERMDARLPREGGAPFLLSHPPNRQRIAALRREAARLKAEPDPP